uniref:FYVE-type domain-containing protein n=1 Tax=Globisporangium ultimum (strain ATCC 200006 / CBS 805.95 / DAOM BR144) TaxID=431595 RepID=K3W5E5_GLOUD
MARPTPHTGAATWTPLRENYFATPLLSAKEKTYLVRKSCEAAQEVVERARSRGGPVQWRHIEKYQDVQIYAGQPRGAFGSQSQSADIMSMCGVTSVAASVKEIAALFDLSTTRSMKEFSMDNRELFYDAIVLYNLSPRTKEKPLHQVTAKWITVKCPRGVEDRDFCYLECQDKFVDSTGRKGWVMCLHSIKLPGCNELTREFGFVRGSFYHSGVIVVETDRPGYVDVIHMLQINFKKNTRVSPSFMRDRVAFVAKIRTMMRDKRLNEQRYLNDLELVPKKYRSRCTVCQDSFTLLLLRKMNCRKCGEVVCGACSKEFDVKNARFMETVKIRVCMQCFQLITTVSKSAQIPMLEQSRQSTAMSFLGYYEDEQRASFMTQVTSSAAELAETSANR